LTMMMLPLVVLVGAPKSTKAPVSTAPVRLASCMSTPCSQALDSDGGEPKFCGSIVQVAPAKLADTKMALSNLVPLTVVLMPLKSTP